MYPEAGFQLPGTWHRAEVLQKQLPLGGVYGRCIDCARDGRALPRNRAIAQVWRLVPEQPSRPALLERVSSLTPEAPLPPQGPPRMNAQAPWELQPSRDVLPLSC